MKRILYVAHRYAPFPGGTENYVRDMAEETLSRGHEVWVFAGQHAGDLNGVRVTSDPSILRENFDLIVVHGGGVSVQDFVLNHADEIPSPILFQLIIPRDTGVYLRAARKVAYIGASTHEDREWAAQHAPDKMRPVRHGINPKISMGQKRFREKYGITTPYMFLSCGGYWQNKAMRELVEVFKRLDTKNITLVTTGYYNGEGLMPEDSEYVKNFLIEDRQDVLDALADADLYIMHSREEGFGLVLLEAMLNRTPWVARYGSGARVLEKFGNTYTTDDELLEFMRYFTGGVPEQIEAAYQNVIQNHSISNTVDDIMRLLDE